MNLYNSSYCYSPPENSFSMLFPGGGGGATDHPNTNTSYSHEMVFDDQYPNNCYSSSSPSSSVDCTLSLGTPSTRHNHQKPSKSSSIWGIFQTKQQPPPPPPQSTGPTPIHHHHHKSSAAGGGGGGGRGGNNSNNMKGDPLLARRCANCDTTSTPLWRNGPRGPKSLCNACGIRYKKEERRASSATTPNSGSVAGVGPTMIDPQYLMGHQYSWAHQQQTTHHHLGNEFMFVQDDDHRDSDNGMPFLSWRLNVPDRSGLIHDYTY